jgi:hypothetical protein
MLVLIMLVTLAVQAQAITPGVWGETNYGYTQPVERAIRYDYDGGWIIVRSGWRWQVTTRAEYTANGTHIVPDAVPWRYGCRFAGWRAPNGVIYHPGDRIQGTGDLRLVAVWEVRR